MMKKIVSLLLLTCVLGLAGCNAKADFDNFSDYEDDFDAVVQFVLEYAHQRNDVDTFLPWILAMTTSRLMMRSKAMNRCLPLSRGFEKRASPILRSPRTI